MARNTILSQFASLGEEALARLAQHPTANRMVQSAMELKERVDGLTRRVRGLESMEQRLEDLERRVDALDGGVTAAPSPEPPALPERAATTTDTSV